jgi:hypothetical protein
MEDFFNNGSWWNLGGASASASASASATGSGSANAGASASASTKPYFYNGTYIVKCNATCCICADGTVIGNCTPPVTPPVVPPGGSGTPPPTGNVTIIVVDENYTSLNETIHELQEKVDCLKGKFLDFKNQTLLERDFMAGKIMELTIGQEELAKL